MDKLILGDVLQIITGAYKVFVVSFPHITPLNLRPHIQVFFYPFNPPTLLHLLAVVNISVMSG